MNTRVKIACVAMVTGLVGYQLFSQSATAEEEQNAHARNAFSYAALNTDGGNADTDVVESSITFRVDVPFAKIKANMFKEGTLKKISPEHVEVNHVQGPTQEGNDIVYKVEETITPLKTAIAQVGTKKLFLILRVNKNALDNEGAIYVKCSLDPDPARKSEFTHFAGRIFAVDLHNGSTMCMVTASTKSTWPLPAVWRVKAARKFLQMTETSIVTWMNTF
jgi:hypothetical protein